MMQWSALQGFISKRSTDGQRTLLSDEDDQQSAWSVRLRERKVRMVESVGLPLRSMDNCTKDGRNRNEDEEVITLGNTPEAWSWKTAANRS